MFDTDYASWGYWTWALYVLAALYVGAFLVLFVRFERLERRAKRDGGDAVLRYNRALRGFPNSIFAKMFGKRAFEVKERGERSEAADAPRPAGR